MLPSLDGVQVNWWILTTYSQGLLPFTLRCLLVGFEDEIVFLNAPTSQ